MSDDFDFDVGDCILVRVREHGTSGNIKAKFEATVEGFQKGVCLTSDYVVLDPPWDGGVGGRVKLRKYDAEFEVLSDGE